MWNSTILQFVSHFKFIKYQNQASETKFKKSRFKHLTILHYRNLLNRQVDKKSETGCMIFLILFVVVHNVTNQWNFLLFCTYCLYNKSFIVISFWPVRFMHISIKISIALHEKVFLVNSLLVKISWIGSYLSNPCLYCLEKFHSYDNKSLMLQAAFMVQCGLDPRQAWKAKFICLLMVHWFLCGASFCLPTILTRLKISEMILICFKTQKLQRKVCSSLPFNKTFTCSIYRISPRIIRIPV